MGLWCGRTSAEPECGEEEGEQEGEEDSKSMARELLSSEAILVLYNSLLAGSQGSARWCGEEETVHVAAEWIHDGQAKRTLSWKGLNREQNNDVLCMDAELDCFI